jgi:DNA modification methylase
VAEFALNRVEIGDCRETLARLPDCVFQTCVTSPPYWGLRDYGHPGQIGLEPTPDEYVANMVSVFREVRRVLRDDGTLWLNLGDTYATRGLRQTGRNDAKRDRNGQGGFFEGGARSATECDDGLKAKDLCGIPWRVAFALQADGWWLRSDIIWAKPNPMPESVTDRPTKAHEYVFLLAKSERYFFDADAIRESAACAGDSAERVNAGLMEHDSDPVRFATRSVGRTCGYPDRRNVRSVWPITSQPYSGAHFATMPPKLVERCIMAGSRIGDAVLDPFIGSGTVGRVAEDLSRRWFGCELNPEYGQLIAERTSQMGLPFAEVAK